MSLLPRRMVAFSCVGLLMVLASSWQTLPAQDPPGDPPTRTPLDQLRAKLAAEVVDVDSNDISLRGLIEVIRGGAGIPTVESPEFSDCFQDESFAIHATQINALALLDQLARLAGFSYDAPGGMLMLRMPDEQGLATSEPPVVAIHDVSSITARSNDYPGVILGPGWSGGAGGPVWESADDDMVQALEVDMLQDIIFENVAPDTWSDDNTIQTVGNALVVRAPSDVQREVRAFLDDLRQRRTSVRITATEWQVTADAWARIAGDSPTSLDAARLAKLQALPPTEARLVSSRMVTARNRQRVNLADTTEFNWVGERESTAAVGTSFRGRAGSMLNVRPVVSVDSDRILMDVTCANVPLLALSDSGPLQLPTMGYRHYSAHVAVRDSESLVLGGSLVPGPELPAQRTADGPTITLLRAERLTHGRARVAAPVDPRRAAMIKKLADTPIDASFAQSCPLLDLMARVSRATGLGYLVSPTVTGMDDEVQLSINIGKMSCQQLLLLASEAIDVVVTPTPDGLLVVTTRDEWSEGAATPRLVRLFDVSDLVFVASDHASPLYGFISRGREGLVISDDSPESGALPIDDMPDLIQQAVDPSVWNGDSTYIGVGPDGQLIVRADEPTLDAVGRLINDLRHRQERMVTLEWELWDVNDVELFRQLGGAAIDNARHAALLTDGRATRRRAGLATMTDGQLVPVVDGQLIAKREQVPGTDGATLDTVSFVLNGMACELRPTYAADDNSVDLGLRTLHGADESQQRSNHSVHLPIGSWVLTSGVSQPDGGSAAHGVLLMRATVGK
ncbi:MAG: hypothetical protein AB7K09_18875 [Planctomycetota bacterium]